MDHTAASLIDFGHEGHGSHGGHDGHGGENKSMCQMSMIFTWDTKDLCVVFNWWHVRTKVGLILTMISIVTLSAGYEFVRYRIRLLDNEFIGTSNALGTNATLSRNYKIQQSLGYAVQVGYSYLLMLIFMTYNGWAMLAVSVGAGLGFWFWGDKAQKSMSCH